MDEKRKGYLGRYNKEHYRTFTIKLHKEYHADLIEMLERKGVTETVKKAIRYDIKNYCNP